MTLFDDQFSRRADANGTRQGQDAARTRQGHKKNDVVTLANVTLQLLAPRLVSKMSASVKIEDSALRIRRSILTLVMMFFVLILVFVGGFWLAVSGAQSNSIIVLASGILFIVAGAGLLANALKLRNRSRHDELLTCFYVTKDTVSVTPVVLGGAQVYQWSDIDTVFLADSLTKKSPFRRESFSRALVVVFRSSMNSESILKKASQRMENSAEGKPIITIRYPAGVKKQIFSQLSKLAPDDVQVINAERIVFDYNEKRDHTI